MKKLSILILTVTFLAISASAQDFDAKLKECFTLTNQKNYPNAIEACSAAIKMKPGDNRPYYYRAMAYLFTKTVSSYENAAADFKKSLEFSPKDAELHYLLGYVIAALDEKETAEYELAIKSFTEAIKLNSDKNDIYYHRGEAYRKAAGNLVNFLYNKDWKTPESQAKSKNYLELAAADYQKSLGINPSLKSASLKLGMTQMSLERYDSAVATLSDYIKNNPNEKTAYENRCYSYYGLKKYQLALADADKALELNKTSAESQAKKDAFSEVVNLVKSEITKDMRKTSTPSKTPVKSTKKL